jgi:hypothetical protein
MKKSKGLAESNSDTKLLSKTASTVGGGAPALASLRTMMKEEKKGSKSGKRSPSKAIRNEKQGPIDWSHLGIKLKYRREREREQLWVEWKKNSALAVTMINSEGMVVPIVKVQRHPIIELYYDRLSIENNSSNERTKSRLLMKKFVLDVQEIWMSNLAHLKEHNTSFLNTYGSEKVENNSNSSSKPGSREQPGSSSTGEDEVEEQNYARGDGLSYRRDVKEIKSYSHQIQSVSQKRIFTKAYHTAKLPAVSVMLDYVASQPPIITGVKPIIPKLQCLLSSLSLLPISSPSSSSASYQLLDRSPCLKSSLAFHIDRLIPSNDFSFYFKDDNYWRFSIIHSESLLQRVYITTEYEITSFVTQFIQEKNYLSSQEEAEQPYYEELYCSETSIIIPYEDGREEWSGILRVYMMYENKIEKMLKFVISTELFPINQINSKEIPPISLNFFFSSLEIRSILNQPFFPILDKSWWLASAERSEDVWKPLLFENHLLLELDYSEGRGIPVGIGWKLPRDQSGLLTGGTAGYTESLTVQQALSCLSELLSAISVQNSEGKENNNNNNNDELPHLYFLRDNGQQLLKLKELTAGKHDSSIIHSFPWNINVSQEVIESQEGSNRVEELTNNEDITKKIQQETEEEPQSWQDKTKDYFNSGNWEFLLELGPNNSFIGNQLYLKYCEIPGGCEIGRKGLGWLKDAVFPLIHRTQVAANFFRDFEHSSTNTIFVHLSLALDYSLLFQPLLVMESFPQLPPPTVADDPPEVIPCTVLKNTMILREYLASPIEKRLSKTIVIFESYPTEGMDYLRRNTPSKPSGYRRHLPVKNEYGFREQIEVSLLQIDPVNDVVVFGITENAALPNETRTNGRNIWHSSVAVNENINR